MNGRMTVLALIGGGLLTLTPGTAQAQVRVDVGVFWTWGDDGWRGHQAPYAYEGGTYDPRRAVPRYPVRYSPVRVPPGHLPPPGLCRLWYPGRPPGHQPPPQPCGSLFQVHGGGGAVIIGGPDYRDEYRYGSGYGYDDRGFGYRDYGYQDYGPQREWKGRGRGRAGAAKPGRGNGRKRSF